MWKVLFDDDFDLWFEDQEEALQDCLYAGFELLKRFGPTLPRPYSDTVKGSIFANMKELRIQSKGHPVRVFYAFDPLRQAFVLCAGDKTGDKRFYEKMIPIADARFKRHLEEL